jgi:hypothetical protein
VRGNDAFPANSTSSRPTSAAAIGSIFDGRADITS